MTKERTAGVGTISCLVLRRVKGKFPLAFRQPARSYQRAERQEALNRRFASNPPRSSADPRYIQKSARQASSVHAAPPAHGFDGDRTPHLRDSVLPSNRRYTGARCHRKPVLADGLGSARRRTFPEVLPWNPLELRRRNGCEARAGAQR